MRRTLALVTVAVCVSIQTLLLDLFWWCSYPCRVFRWLNGWYHVAVYLPSIVVPLLIASRIARLGTRSTVLYVLGGLSLATWVNDFFWYPALGQPEKLVDYCFRFTWENWSRVHIGFTPYIPWWLFSLSNVLRPLIAPMLISVAIREASYPK